MNDVSRWIVGEPVAVSLLAAACRRFSARWLAGVKKRRSDTHRRWLRKKQREAVAVARGVQ